jgi:hypothetical protein
VRKQKTDQQGVAQPEAFRKTIGQVSRKYWATVGAEERRERAKKGVHARLNRRLARQAQTVIKAKSPIR